MSFFKDVWVDLVDKKLWPVAAALVLALIAAPVLLAKDSEEGAGPVAAAAAPAGTLPDPVVTRAIEQNIGLLSGKARDPFAPKLDRSAGSEDVDTALAAIRDTIQSGRPAGAGNTSAPLPSTGGNTSPGTTGTGGTGTNPGANPTPREQPGPKELRVAVRYGIFGSTLGIASFAPLTALPPAADPFLIFLGRAKDGRTAVFALAGDTTPQAGGFCRPSRRLCNYLHMKPGDEEALTVKRPNGKSFDYELEVLSYTSK